MREPAKGKKASAALKKIAAMKQMLGLPTIDESDTCTVIDERPNVNSMQPPNVNSKQPSNVNSKQQPNVNSPLPSAHLQNSNQNEAAKQPPNVNSPLPPAQDPQPPNVNSPLPLTPPLPPVHDSHTTPHNPSCPPLSSLLPVKQPPKILPNAINRNTIIWSSDDDRDYDDDDDGRDDWSGAACCDALASLPELKTDAGTSVIEFTALVDLVKDLSIITSTSSCVESYVATSTNDTKNNLQDTK